MRQPRQLRTRLQAAPCGCQTDCLPSSLGRQMGSLPLLREPVAIFRVRPFVNIFDGEQALSNQLIKQLVGIVNARSMGHPSNWPIGQSGRMLVCVIEMSKVEGLEKLG